MFSGNGHEEGRANAPFVLTLTKQHYGAHIIVPSGLF